MTYEPRTYRTTVEPVGLECFRVCVKETDLLVCAERDLSEAARDLVLRARADIESHIAASPRFAESYVPVDVPDSAPEIVRRMAAAAHAANVGPMASVAGAVAEYVARGLEALSSEVIVENGGDLYVVGRTDRTVALWAGESAAEAAPQVGLLVRGSLAPVGVCTSSGTVGPSESFGRADAVTVLARDGALADAVATQLGNRVRDPEDVDRAVEAARGVHGVLGVVVVLGERLGAWGNVHLVPLG